MTKRQMTPKSIEHWQKIASDITHPNFEALAWGVMHPAYRTVGIHGLLNGKWKSCEFFDLTAILRNPKDPRCAILRRIVYHLGTTSQSGTQSDQPTYRTKRIVWETILPESIDDARSIFQEMVKTGWRAYRVGLGAKPVMSMKQFDPTAEEMLMVWPNGRKQ